jgi:hypothetical protein
MRARKERGHSRSDSRARLPLAMAVTSGLVAVGLVAGGCQLLSSIRGAAKPPATTRATPAKGSKGTHNPSHPRTATPLQVLSVTPRAGDRSVAFSPVVTVRFSSALAAGQAQPRLQPSPPGTWQRSGSELVFHPLGNFAPYTKVTLTIPGGARGLQSVSGGRLASTQRIGFTIEGASVLRLQELLAELGYLPLQFVPGTNGATQAAPLGSSGSTSSSAKGSKGSSPTTTLPGPPPSVTRLSSQPEATATSIQEPSKISDIPLQALAGHFVWRFKDVPRQLSSLWTPGAANVITTGAVMRFELDHGLATDGQAGPKVWWDLLKAVAWRQTTKDPYDWVYVTEGSPEYLDLWSNGRVIFQSLVNTGISQSPTQVGTWPVYERFLTTTMSGTEPNGQHYSDPGIPWVSYFHGGDALHGFIRTTYGWPQSLGCVEMPFSSAHTVFPFTPIGTLVTVAA